MSIENYWIQLKEIENNFNKYKKDLDNIIEKVSSTIHHTVITKGKIANPTPYRSERMGNKVNGKVLQTPIISDDCMKYHYDSENRIIMIEEYNVYFKKFQIVEIYFHNELTEGLRLSCGILAVLSVFDNAFSNTQLYLAFAGYNGYRVEEFMYDGDNLSEIKASHSKNGADEQTEIHRFLYENRKLIQIERVCQNGYRDLEYTTKKPNFNKIREDVYNGLKKLITDYKGDFASLGIEGFIDQREPMFCVCFTEDNNPSDLIADWNVEMYDVLVYDWQLNDAQEKKCVRIIAEIIVELVKEGLLRDKKIYFHQSLVCVTQLYLGAKSVFKKAGINVE